MFLSSVLLRGLQHIYKSREFELYMYIWSSKTRWCILTKEMYLILNFICEWWVSAISIHAIRILKGYHLLHIFFPGFCTWFPAFLALFVIFLKVFSSLTVHLPPTSSLQGVNLSWCFYFTWSVYILIFIFLDFLKCFLKSTYLYVAMAFRNCQYIFW